MYPDKVLVVYARWSTPVGRRLLYPMPRLVPWSSDFLEWQGSLADFGTTIAIAAIFAANTYVGLNTH